MVRSSKLTWQLVFTSPVQSHGDGTVGFGDLVLLLSSFGPCDNCPADFNGNSAVDFEDVVRLLSAWG